MSPPKPAKSATASRTTRTQKTTVTTNGAAAVVTDEQVAVKARVASRKTAVAVKTEVSVEEKTIATKKRKVDDEQVVQEKPAAKKPKTKAKKPADRDEPEGEDEDREEKQPAKKRKTKAEKEAEENMVLASRTAATALKKAMFIGAHVSAAGGVHNSIQNASKIGANAFALFLKSQRKWESPPLAAEHRDEFLARLKQHGYDAAKHILPHGSYLINLAQADKAKADQAYASFLDDLKRCEALGIKLYNFHPGSTGGDTKETACARIAAQLNRAIKETKSVVPVLECMCGSGNVVGSTFEELRDIIAAVEDKSRVGVCIDTCHAFAAGYDLRTPDAFAETMARFDEIVGLQYLKALHLNDSKAPFASHRDLHANIGTGFLGLRAFHNVMNYAPFQHLPMVLETPIDVKGPDGKTVEDRQIWADEIKLLESLIGMDPASPALEARAAELQARGAAERARIQGQVDKKVGKDAKKAEGGAKKAARKATAANGAKKKGGAKKKRPAEDDESELSSCDSCGEE